MAVETFDNLYDELDKKESFLLNKNNLNRHTNITIKYVKSYFDSLNKNQLAFSEKFKKVNLYTASK